MLLFRESNRKSCHINIFLSLMILFFFLQKLSLHKFSKLKVYKIVLCSPHMHQ